MRQAKPERNDLPDDRERVVNDDSGVQLLEFLAHSIRVVRGIGHIAR